MENRIKSLRYIGIAEGISFLVLLFIAMPLKYYMGLPVAVMVVGWIHGVLFIAYVAAVFLNTSVFRGSFVWVMVALLAALLPFGTFALDRELKKRQRELIRSL